MKYLPLLSVLVFIFACTPKTAKKMDATTDSISVMTDAQLRLKADELAHKFIIVDGHVDLPYRLKIQNFRFTKELMGIPIETDEGDFDYKRSKEGGLDAPFMSIYIPSSYQKKGGAKEYADSLIDMVSQIAKELPEYYSIAVSPTEVAANFKKGILSLPMGMENGAPIEDDLANVAYFHERGIRYITLTHSKDNQICDSSYDETRTWNGLSPYGRDVVKEMNRVGIMIDVSHISDSTFYQVMELTKVPVIASHSSCRKFLPGFERNMNDDMLKKLAENDGVIMINFGSTFIDAGVRETNHGNWAKLDSLLNEKQVHIDSIEGKALVEQFRKDNPTLYADVETVVEHIDHVVQLVGVDHVGFGSDFDGVGDSLPTGLKDVSQYPNILFLLLKKGYSEEDIAKICYKNVFRVWSQVETHAAKMK